MNFFSEFLASYRSFWEWLRTLFTAVAPYKRRFAALLLGGVLVVYVIFFQASASFPVNELVRIKNGTSLSQIAEDLQMRHIIYSPLFFKTLVVLKGGEGGVLAGDYFFNTPTGLSGVVSRLTEGKFGLKPLRITIPEGASSYEIAEILGEVIGGFDTETFNTLAREKEGYLFPDTYLFLPNVLPETVILEMEENFDDKVQPLESDIKNFGSSLREILTLASLLEKEARQEETRRTIAGILWNRLAIDMPLQVDAVFGYIKGTATFHPSFEDLEVDSPYNTYRYKGLPPGPIGNPGLSSIRAAITPMKTDYLFYLTDSEGGIHYSETFEGHVRNRALYLD